MDFDLKTAAANDFAKLSAGEVVKLDGAVFTARDQTCVELFGENPPEISWENKVVFFAGPSPTPPGKVCGSIGPTTSTRMEKYFEEFLSRGARGFLGKGEISPDAIEILKKSGAVFFVAVGGVAALSAQKIAKMKTVAFQNLGPEAVFEIEFQNFPAVVAVDARGKNIFPK